MRNAFGHAGAELRMDGRLLAALEWASSPLFTSKPYEAPSDFHSRITHGNHPRSVREHHQSGYPAGRLNPSKRQ